ncbi:MAG TPA: bifunctional serine/threonine-protein kinase/formylglycine-generating enzyme family protein [Bryobacteraceae bacterium]|nr:bifunctional serine/threonine-protein kinase/formylglycine-generating enzyme family protein [Bryobacteraceae bacterium]
MPSKDRYQIVEKLGEGGMGEVFLATDTWLKRDVAIKKIKPRDEQSADDREKTVQRVIREAQASASLKHPHIVSIYDVVPDESPPCIIMEFVRGVTLGKTAPLGKPADRALALRVLRECADALDYAFSRHRIHRDFKPGNVMLDEAGNAMIMDFGVAKMLDIPSDSTFGKVTGTWEFMSPEQIKAEHLDGRSDQYSLAVVAYQLLTGCRVFEAELLGTLISMVLLQPPAAPGCRNPALPEAVDAVLLKALSKKPADRYDSCTEFISELSSKWMAGGPPRKDPGERTTVKMPASALRLGHKPGEVRVNDADRQRYVWIPAGTFQMGCSPNDPEAYDDEKPAHPVTLSHGFWMGELPVTEKAYKLYCEAAGKPMPLPAHGHAREESRNDHLPVVMITWDEAVEYCKWAGGRLPTEAEWEYAARAGTTEPRYGNLADIAWYKDNSAGPPPAGLKKPNAFGLFDMLGNVWEWTADWYSKDYYQAMEKQDPQGPPTGVARTMRGGSWYDYARAARASGRSQLGPGYRYEVIGFRCVL